MSESDITFPESGITPPQPLAPEPVFAGLSERGIDFGAYKINTANVDYYYKSVQSIIRAGTRMVETLFDVSQKKLRLEANQKKEQANLRIREITTAERRHTETMRRKEIAMRMRLLTQSSGTTEASVKERSWGAMRDAMRKAREYEEKKTATALKAEITHADKVAEEEFEDWERRRDEKERQRDENAFWEYRR